MLKEECLEQGETGGAEVASGDIFLFLDADVVLDGDFLNRAIAIFKKNNLGIAGFPVLPSDGNTVDKFFYRALNFFFFSYSEIFAVHSMRYFSQKKCAPKNGGF